MTRMRRPPLAPLLLAALCALSLASCSGGGKGDGPIEILIDEDGVPHIYAQSDEDAFYGMGYQTAVDRMYQLEMIRRFAQGRLSEVLGEEGLMRDQQARAFDFARWGRADYELTQEEYPKTARLVQAWVDGINRRVEEVRSGDAPVPFGFEQHDFLPTTWEPVDPYIVLKGAGFANDRSVEFEIALTLVTDLFPEAIGSVQLFKPAHDAFSLPPAERPSTTSAPFEHDAIEPPPSMTPERRELLDRALERLRRMADSLPRGASNNWAIDGRHTENGKPLIAGDPHLSFDFFGAPYPLHVNSKDAGGTYDVAGVVYPGTPGITLGHNDRLAWTVTTAFADVTDIWAVDKTADGIRLGGEVVPVEKREEEIVVRGEGMPAGEGETMTATYTDVPGYGVLLPRSLAMDLPLPDTYLIAWPGFKARPLRWFMALNDVESLGELEETVDSMDEMNYNVVGATEEGIAYRVGVEVPDRGDVSGDRAPWKALDGDDPATLWTGEMLPQATMPRSRGEERGWLFTANNDPFGFTQDGDPTNDPWYYSSLFAPHFRAHRIEQELGRLTDRGDLTIEDMKALQLDTHSVLADDLVPLLGEAWEAAQTDDALADFRDDAKLGRVVTLLTDEWDREMTRESSGAVAFHAFAHYVTEGVLRDDITLAYDFAIELQAGFVMKIAALALRGEYPDGENILQEGRNTILLTAAQRTAELLESRFGDVDPSGYSYADIKVTDFSGALGTGVELFSRPTDGGESTLNVSTNLTFGEDAEQWSSSWVAVERSVARFHDDGTPQLFYNTPFTGSGDPDAPESQAALEDYVEGNYREMRFRRADVEAAAADRREIRRK